MTLPNGLTRRALLMKLGIFFNGLIALALAVPIVRYLLSPIVREKKGAYDAWVALGNLDQFPSGQTRLATYRNPVVNPWDGDTADIACWVRNVDGQNFQVFAINCAHLGCPVRWFPQSSLFMCPATAAFTIRMARALPARPNAACSNITTRLMAGDF